MFSTREKAPQSEFTISERARTSVQKKKAEEKAAAEEAYNQKIESAALLFVAGVQRVLKSSSSIETLMNHFKSVKISKGVSMGLDYKLEDVLGRIQEKLNSLPEYVALANVAAQHGWELAVLSTPGSVTITCTCDPSIPCGHKSSSAHYNKIDLVLRNNNAPAEMRDTEIS